MNTIKQVTGYQTSDGTVWYDPDEAQRHQDALNFREWCRENICIGGEWSADMVATAILETWKVAR